MSEITNAEFAITNFHFIVACELAKIANTKRQASKYRRKTGLAHQAERAHLQTTIINKELGR